MCIYYSFPSRMTLAKAFQIVTAGTNWSRSQSSSHSVRCQNTRSSLPPLLMTLFLPRAIQTESWHMTTWWKAHWMIANSLPIYSDRPLFFVFDSSTLFLTNVMWDKSVSLLCRSVYFPQTEGVNDSLVINRPVDAVYSQSKKWFNQPFQKWEQSDMAISHSMALPKPFGSHADCIRNGWAGAQQGSGVHLSYLRMERRFRKSTWSGGTD